MAPAYPYPLTNIRSRPTPARINPLQRPLLGLLWINVALGAYVITEPAPYDIAILVVFALAICTQAIQVSRELLVAGSALLLFLVTTGILIAPPTDWALWLRHSGATVVLSVSWVLFAGVTHRFGARGAHIILSAYTIAASLAALAGLAGYFDLIPNLRPFVVSWNRARSFFKDPNVFGPFLLAPALTCAMWIQSKSATTLNRVLVGGAAMIMLVATFLTYSRAAYATTLFGVFVYAVLTGVLRSWRSFLWLSVALGGAVFLLSFIPDAAEVLGQRLERQSYDEDRFQIFEQALTLGTSNLMGVGAGQAHLILGYGVHSMYLRLFADHGAPGLAAFLLFICACLTRMVAQIRRAQSVKARRLAALILAASVSTLLNGFVIETIHWRHLWLLLGLCWYPFPNQIQQLSAARWSRYGGQTN